MFKKKQGNSISLTATGSEVSIDNIVSDCTKHLTTEKTDIQVLSCFNTTSPTTTSEAYKGSYGLSSENVIRQYSEDFLEEEPDCDFPEQIELQGFKLITKIGEGAFSKVYRAIPLPTNSNRHIIENYKQLAVKVINKKELESQKNKVLTREQVLKEVVIHKAVSGAENIVTFITFQETSSYYFIVQELLSGGEIFGEIVRLTYFSEDLTRHIIKQLALAVKHMHSLGIVHRDIKPENLLFEPIKFIPSVDRKFRRSDDHNTKEDEGQFIIGVGGGGIGLVKLADFGLSKQIFQTNTKTPCGTVGYTAPEVVRDERYSTKVDMWGIGCVLYTMLCGFPPFYNEKIDILTEKISRGEYTFLRPWWDEISNDAKDTVTKLLEVDPEKRYGIDDFLADPWLNKYDCEKNNLSGEKKQGYYIHQGYKRNESLIYSPAAVVMRDAFDISNAVQRIEQDKKSTAAGTNLKSLFENEEETFQLDHNLFQLNLDGSTILKRRRNKLPRALISEVIRE